MKSLTLITQVLEQLKLTQVKVFKLSHSHTTTNHTQTRIDR